MTLLDERPATGSPSEIAPVAERRVTAPATSWRFAARLARREVRRRPGRTLLVMLLVIVPVIGMALGTIVYRTTNESNPVRFHRQYGSADVVVSLQSDNPFGFVDGSDDPLRAPGVPALPPGAQTMNVMTVGVPVRADVNGIITTEWLTLTDADLTNPMISDAVLVDDGRAPTDVSEVLLSPYVADRFDVDVGDELRLVRPDLVLEVVGIGRSASRFGDTIMVIPDFDRELLQYAQYSTLIEFTTSTTDADVDRFVSSVVGDTFYVQSPRDQWYTSDGDTARTLAWGWVAGVVALVAVGIVITAAFATSARRQLVTIGQLSANGASERLVRRAMALQGMWTGLLGATLGVALAVSAAVVAMRTGWFEKAADHQLSGVDIAPLDMLVIVATATLAATVAALVPARSAARIPVHSALAGRRPVVTPPTWLAPVGVALVVSGLFLLGGAASVEEGGDFVALLAVIGAVSVMLGMACASPLIVAAVGSVGGRAGGVIRLASRSLSRSRSRSAAVLTAIATVGAIAVVAATVAPAASDANSGYEPDLRTVRLGYSVNSYDRAYEDLATGDASAITDPPPEYASPLPQEIRQGVERIVPDADWFPITQTVYDPPPFRIDTGEPVVQPVVGGSVRQLTSLTVADDVIIDQLGLTDGQLDILDDVGVVTLQPWNGPDAVLVVPGGAIEIDLGRSLAELGFDGVPTTDEEIADAVQLDGADRPFGDTFVSPEFVAEYDIDTTVATYLVANPTDLTDAQRDAINNLQPGVVGEDAFTRAASAPGFDDLGTAVDGSWYPWFDSPSSSTPTKLIQLGVALVSLILVLGVVAVGLSLAASESRDERDVLHAVGASPRTLRRVAAAKAWVLTTGAAVVAVPIGYVTIFVVSRATETRAPFPFAIAIALLVVIPALAAAATLATSAMAQRSRPATYATVTANA